MSTGAEAGNQGVRTARRRRAGGWLGASTLAGAVLLPASVTAVPYTGTGGGPETTVNAPYRAGSGQTVPTRP